MVGKSFCALTVTTNVSVAVAPSASVTVKVIVAVPDSFNAGTIVTVRSAPSPVITMLVSGTRVVLEELPLTSNKVTAVSTSPIVKGIASLATSSVRVWFPTSVIVGRLLVTPTVNVLTALSAGVPSSVTLTLTS